MEQSFRVYEVVAASQSRDMICVGLATVGALALTACLTHRQNIKARGNNVSHQRDSRGDDGRDVLGDLGFHYVLGERR